TSGYKRIYIIDEVHRLSGPAFDALLKTLEEPPEHVMFIFATTEPLKVPETILSRTQRFDFKRVSINDLTTNLSKISQAENLKINEAGLRLIARKADGSVRDSLSLLDQIASYSLGEITEEEIIKALGLVDRQFIFDFITAIAAKESKQVLKLIKNVFESGVDPKDFVGELLEHFRVLLILATDKNATDLLEVNPDEIEGYLKQADYFSLGDIMRLIKMAADLNTDLKESGLDERLLLEMTAVKMAEMEATVKFEDVLKLMRQNAQGLSNSSSGSDLFGSFEKKKDDYQTDKLTFVKKQGEADNNEREYTPLSTSIINLPTLKAGWDNFISILRQQRPMLASQLGMVEVREIVENKLLLVFPASGETSKLIVEKKDNLNLIVTTLKEHFKTNLSIKFDIDPKKENFNIKEQNLYKKNNIDLEKLVEKSPRIKMLLDKVDGQIIGVKKAKK
ncbi:MAG: hypothetical protein GXO93_00790, partial [FCB group bacterium]|nr:hypothetical protein [FCB group bacterium]